MSTSLTVEIIHEAIDRVLQSAAADKHGEKISAASSSTRSSWRRVVSTEDWQSIASIHMNRTNCKDLLCSNKYFYTGRPFRSNIPFYFGIQSPLLHGSFCTFYLAYSTWDGRMLNVDQLVMMTHHHDEYTTQHETCRLYRLLARIAVHLQCARLSWKEKEEPRWNPSRPPEFLEDWIFLEMDRSAMSRFLGVADVKASSDTSAMTENGTNSDEPFDRAHVENVIRRCLRFDIVNNNREQGTNERFTLRLADSTNMETVAHLVRQLAIYENEPDAVHVTADDYRLDGGSDSPLFYCLLAEVLQGSHPATCGMGLFYFGYELNHGNFLYLEDLFVEEAYRGKGTGKALMKKLAQISLAMQCSKFSWTALDWNATALGFYQKIGATRKNQEKITRYCGPTIHTFASENDI